MVKRYFEVVKDEFRKHGNVEIKLPVRGDKRSAGYDFITPVDIELKPGERKLIFTDVKAFMQDDEVLELHVRSSIGCSGIILQHCTGIIDSSYFNNPKNDGNIGIPLWNTSENTIFIEAGERVCQGVFKKYLVADNNQYINEERTGGFGSSGRC